MPLMFEKYESHAKSYCKKFPTIFEKGKDSLIFDLDGRAYIDLLAGAGSLNYGHNNEQIKNSVIEYMSNNGLALSLDLHSASKRSFLEAFVYKILEPRQLDFRIQFTSPTGTSVIESALKLARKFTNRDNVLCFTNGFHGMTGNALSITGSDHHRQRGMSSQVTRLPFEGYLGNDFDYIGYYRKLLTDPSSGVDLPAAVVVEVIQGEGGLNVASNKWLQGLRQLTYEHNILFIVDDIQAGCGRSGNFFSFEESGIKPDMVCLSKSLGGMGLPLSLLLITPKADIWKPAEDNGTFRGNNLAFVAATTMIEQFWSNSEFEQSVQQKAQKITSFLSEIANEYDEFVLKVKGRGLMQGVLVKDPVFSEYIVNFCFANYLLLERCGPTDEVLKLMPALTIDDETLSKALTIIRQAFVSLRENSLIATDVIIAE
ncbi:MAG: diaminobutyrate-2-oxoglutarate transaminase [Paraglaciecola sp.]|jgi:diaminobutyrate-2-oxoglutarate transaminase